MNNQSMANILFCVAGVLWGIELIPQILKTIKSKCVKDISLPYYFICLSAYFIYITGAILINQWYIVYSHLLSLVMLVIMLYLLLKYRKNQ